MRRPALVLGCIVLAAWTTAAGIATSRAQPAPSRGELLYATHCLACHSAQIHWRDRKVAHDWPTLRAQVDLWQRAGALGWTEEDIQSVTDYLNRTIYGFAGPVISRGVL